MKKLLAALLVLLLCPIVALADVTVDVSHWYGEDGEFAVFTAYDENGSEAWRFETESDLLGELDSISWFETGHGGHVLLVNVTNSSLTAYNVETGDMIWNVPVSEYSFGAGCTFAMDEAGNTYVGGYYGPDPVCLSPEGEILWMGDSGMEQDMYWLYRILPIESGILAVYEAWFPDGGEPSDDGGYVIYGADGAAVASGTATFSGWLHAMERAGDVELGTAGSSLKIAYTASLALDGIESGKSADADQFTRIAASYISSMTSSARTSFAEAFAASDETMREIIAGDEDALEAVRESGAIPQYEAYSLDVYEQFYAAVIAALEG